MATHPDFNDPFDDFGLHGLNVRRQTSANLEHKVQSLQAEVEMLQQCLHDSLDLQKDILKRWSNQTNTGDSGPLCHSVPPFPAASSTPYMTDLYNERPNYLRTGTPYSTQTLKPESHLQSDPVDLISITQGYIWLVSQ